MNTSADRLIEVFNEAKALSAGTEREQFLAVACQHDPQLQQHVSSLLHADEAAGDFLQAPQLIAPAKVLTEKPGDRIGRYKLLEQIGEGGCGVVYMAEQEEPVRRRVALKVIKLGMDTKQVIARFEAERQALALMDHPNIARVLDAGATDTGRPFFVMELVRGIKITNYCDQNNLSTNERLELFIQVCQAIQHAHQKGIIHRDIKPSNILVTQHDDVAVPKVIDFGIAKATTGQLTDKTLFTAFAQFIGTPAYMSPEQAMMTSLDIDTRTDIYALGVLLYELLTGQTPFDAKELMAAGLDAMRLIIRDEEPARPSTRLSTMLAADLTTVARNRQAEPGRLGTLLRGDLDWIVMKALEKDRTRRYETANGLAVDIQRHLANEPVVARPPGNLYRIQKLIRRNKVAFTAASVVAGALVIGLGISTWLFFKEKEARQRAGTEAARSEQVSAFLKEMLKGVGPSVALGRDTTMLREILDQTAARIGKDLKDQPGVEAELRNTIGNVYWALGEYEKAAAMHREALAMRRKLLGNEHPDVAQSLSGLARALSKMKKKDEAETMLREALAAQRKVLGNENLDVASLLNDLAVVLLGQNKLEESEATCRQALGIREKLLGRENLEVAGSLHDLALVLHQQRKFAEAERVCRQALAMRKKLLGDEHPDIGNSLSYLGRVLQAQGKLQEAELLLRQALAMKESLLGKAHPDVAASLFILGSVLSAQGKSAEVEARYKEELAARRKRLGNEHPDVAAALHDLAIFLRWQGKLDEAGALHREALTMRRKLFGNEDRTVVTSLRGLADILQSQGKLAEAEAVRREELATEKKLSGDEDPFVAVSLNYLAQVLREQSKLAEAETTFREALAMRRMLSSNEQPVVANMLSSLGWVLWEQSKHAEAEDTFREALGLQRKLLGNEHPDVAGTLSSLGSVLHAQGKLTAAEVAIREALGMRRKLFGTEHPEVANSLALLGETLSDQGKQTEAETTFREALAMRKKLLGNEHRDVIGSLRDLTKVFQRQGKLAGSEALLREELVHARTPDANAPSQVSPRLGWILHHLADVLREKGALDEARALAEEATTLYERHPDWPAAESQHASRVLAAVLTDLGDFAGLDALDRKKVHDLRARPDADDPQLAAALAESAHHLLVRKKFAEAESAYREALAMLRKRFGNEHPEVATSLHNLAGGLRGAGKLPESEMTHREALAMRRKLLGNEHPDVDGSLDSLTSVLREQGKLADAEALLRDELVKARTPDTNAPSQVRPRLGWILYKLADVLRERKSLKEARTLAGEASSFYERHPDWHAAEREYASRVLAAVLTDLGDFAGLEALHRKKVDDLRARLPADDPQLTAALVLLTRVLLVQKKFSEAEAPARECLSIRETKLPDDWQTFHGRSLLGHSLLGQKKYAEAEPLLLSGYEGIKQREDKIPAGSKRNVIKASLRRLAQLCEATGQSEKAAEWHKKLAAEAEKKTAVTKP